MNKLFILVDQMGNVKRCVMVQGVNAEEVKKKIGKTIAYHHRKGWKLEDDDLFFIDEVAVADWISLLYFERAV